MCLKHCQIHQEYFPKNNQSESLCDIESIHSDARYAKALYLEKVPEDEIDEKKLLRHHMKFHRHRQKVNARPESEQYTYIEIIPDKKCKCVEQK